VVLSVVALGACGDDGPSEAERAATFCTRLDRLARNDPFTSFGDRATDAEIEAAFTALVARADELLDVAPGEARAAARDYAEASAALNDLMAGAAYDATAVDQRAYRDEQATYVAAAQRLERYLESEC
jgi:hypothetical protein